MHNQENHDKEDHDEEIHKEEVIHDIDIHEVIHDLDFLDALDFSIHESFSAFGDIISEDLIIFH